MDVVVVVNAGVVVVDDAVAGVDVGAAYDYAAGQIRIVAVHGKVVDSDVAGLDKDHVASAGREGPACADAHPGERGIDDGRGLALAGDFHRFIHDHVLVIAAGQDIDRAAGGHRADGVVDRRKCIDAVDFVGHQAVVARAGVGDYVAERQAGGANVAGDCPVVVDPNRRGHSQGQRYVVAVPAAVADDEGHLIDMYDGAFGQTGKRAGDGIRAVVVDERKHGAQLGIEAAGEIKGRVVERDRAVDDKLIVPAACSGAV